MVLLAPARTDLVVTLEEVAVGHVTATARTATAYDEDRLLELATTAVLQTVTGAAFRVLVRHERGEAETWLGGVGVVATALVVGRGTLVARARLHDAVGVVRREVVVSAALGARAPGQASMASASTS